MLAQILDVTHLEARPLGRQVRKADRNQRAVGKDVALRKQSFAEDSPSDEVRPGGTMFRPRDRAGARRCFLEALGVAKEAQIAPVMLDALLGIAWLRRGEGDTESALELVLHVLQNSACSQETRDRAQRLRTELVAQVPGEQIGLIQTQAQAKTLDTVAQELLAAR
jgi:hypothetical protein